MIPDLTSPAVANVLPAVGQRGQPVARTMFDVYARVRREQPATGERGPHLRQQRRIVGWIEKCDVERRTTGSARQPAEGVTTVDLRTFLTPFAHQRLDGRGCAPILLDEAHVRGPPRQRLEPQCAASGEEIEDSRARYPWLQPIEQGFPHPVRCGTDRDAGGKTQPPSPMLAPDDAQDARRAG